MITLLSDLFFDCVRTVFSQITTLNDELFLRFVIPNELPLTPESGTGLRPHDKAFVLAAASP